MGIKTGIVQMSFPVMLLLGRYRDAVGRHNLRLIREHFAGAAIDIHLQPLHVISAILLIVTERLDTSEVFEALAGCIEKRLIDPEIRK
jgi:hypothetical protein